MLNIFFIFILTLNTIFLPLIPVTSVEFNKEVELSFYQMMISDPEQQRIETEYDEQLASIARKHACEMAGFNYFDHVNLAGHGPNFRLRLDGIRLPNDYEDDIEANNVESLAAGYPNVAIAYEQLKQSKRHRNHILGLTKFFARQNKIGVGYCELDGSEYGKYYVILSYEEIR